MNSALTAVNNILPTLLGFAVLVMFGLWRNALWREHSARRWVGYLERDRGRLQKLLYQVAEIDNSMMHGASPSVTSVAAPRDPNNETA